MDSLKRQKSVVLGKMPAKSVSTLSNPLMMIDYFSFQVNKLGRCANFRNIDRVGYGDATVKLPSSHPRFVQT